MAIIPESGQPQPTLTPAQQAAAARYAAMADQYKKQKQGAPAASSPIVVYIGGDEGKTFQKWLRQQQPETTAQIRRVTRMVSPEVAGKTQLISQLQTANIPVTRARKEKVPKEWLKMLEKLAPPKRNLQQRDVPAPYVPPAKPDLELVSSFQRAQETATAAGEVFKRLGLPMPDELKKVTLPNFAPPTKTKMPDEYLREAKVVFDEAYKQKIKQIYDYLQQHYPWAVDYRHLPEWQEKADKRLSEQMTTAGQMATSSTSSRGGGYGYPVYYYFMGGGGGGDWGNYVQKAQQWYNALVSWRI